MRFTRALDLSSCRLHLSFAPGVDILVIYQISLSCGPAGQLESLHLCVEAFINKMCFISFICAIASVVWCWIILKQRSGHSSPKH